MSLLAGPIFAGLWYLLEMLPATWGWWQYVLFVVLATDLLGGLTANVSSSNQAYWQAQPLMLRIIFLGIHASQPALLLLFWDYGAAPLLFIYMFAAAAISLGLAGEKRRLWLIASCFVGMLLFRQLPAGMEWFAPAYLLKLLISYAMPHPTQ